MRKKLVLISFFTLISSFMVGCASTQSNQLDASYRLHDIWALEQVAGVSVKPGNYRQQPTMEINITEMRVMGNDGCNNYSGQVKTADDSHLVFGPLAGTRKFCPDMEIPDLLGSALANVQQYQIENLRLHLLDANSEELMVFRKVD